MGKEGLREILEEITKHVLAELSPERCLSRAVRLEGERLCAGPYRYDLRRFRRVLVVGFGKAAARMAQGLEEILAPRISAGFVATAEGYSVPTRIVEVAEAGHPLPDERTIRAAIRIGQMVRDAGEDDLLIVLVSGGGSALFELPAAGLALEDIVRTTNLLLRSGATIQELNAVRKHLSQVKGGRLARLAWPAHVLGLVLSDVPGDDLSTIASGPLYPDLTTFAQAVEILRRRGVWEEVPSAVRDYLSRGAEGGLPETPKPGDPWFSKVRHVIVGSGRTALAAAQRLGHKMGFRALVLTSTMRGEAREAGKFFAGLAEEERGFGRPVRPPALLLAAGETTVTVRGKGLGGRNQELALAFALEIQGLSGVALLSLATDGRDGPTDAAGAIADGGSCERMETAGIDPKEALLRNDSYRALSASGDLLRIGPTGTNVADLVILAVERRHSAQGEKRSKPCGAASGRGKTS
ncbi:MAG: glycerate kinase type-2 family protein [Candidatus Bipolaricaulaceae bacterium]